MAYEVRFNPQRGTEEYDRVLSIAGVTPKGPGAMSDLTRRAWNAIGVAPATPQGTRLTYSSGARGPTPNVPDFVVEAYSISFAQQVVEEDANAGRFYLTFPAFYFLDALVRAFQKRPDLTTRARLQCSIRRLLEENSPDRGGQDAATAFSNVEDAVVVPTYLGFTDTALMLNVDILIPLGKRIENYAGAGNAAPGGGGGGGGNGGTFP